MLILASKSPRRSELLNSAGVLFEQIPANIDESPKTGELPGDLVLRLAKEKARVLGKEYKDRFILSGDTVVVLDSSGMQQILGQPNDAADARNMLRRLSGSKHSVYSSFALYCEKEEYLSAEVVKTEVLIRTLSDEEIAGYVATGEPLDKAGAYAIQGKGAGLVKEINGSYTSVVGLPLAEVLVLLQKVGIWKPAHYSEAKI
ncbi:hypothetical protein BVY02_01940 [bacterium J17]|nr:hypothetical protein BVY02_01940 [bacterium J17]